MGGNAFPVQATRMSTPTHALLLAHAQSALVPAFFPRAEALRDVREKQDHGDLDLIAGWEDERAWKLKGEERGEVDGGMGLGGAMVLRAERARCEVGEGGGEGEWKAGKGGDEDGDAEELDQWAYRMARALKAKEWVRRGSEISFAIPCNVIHDGADENTFYQLDVPFVPYPALTFYLLTVSYSSTFLILARALRCISSSFTLQMVGLIIRHAAYPGIPGIDVLLTPSADDLCDYLGLDRKRWEEGFDNELEVWQWLASVREGGMLQVAYRKMVRPRAVRQKGHKKKKGALDGFVAYLRTTKWGEGWEGENTNTTAGQVSALEGGSSANAKEGAARPETPIDRISNHIASDPVPPLTPSSTTTSMSSAGPLTPSSSSTFSISTPTSLNTSTSTSASSTSNTSEAVHPDHPIPLDERALSALARWNKQAAYDKELAERRVKAAYLYERQQERIQRSARAGEMRVQKGVIGEDAEGLGVRLAAAAAI